MSDRIAEPNWGNPPWAIDFRPTRIDLPPEVDFAVVGAGFSGLSAAAWLRRMAPDKSVAVFEADRIGAGSSGHTGGMALAETAAGDLPGLGDVLAGFEHGLNDLGVECNLSLPGVWEIGRTGAGLNSPIAWQDSGRLHVLKTVPGGTIDPGKLVSGLARSAERAGAMIFENAGVEKITYDDPIALHVRGASVRAGRLLLATNAMSLELNHLHQQSQPKFTLAVATEALRTSQIEELGLASGKPFYTTDLPYLWGRLLHSGAIVFGGGLVHFDHWSELHGLDVNVGEASKRIENLEERIRGLHPVLHDVAFPHRWGGPILIAEAWRPVFAPHPRNPRIVVLGGYSGHGVALSSYLGRWAAEVMLGRRELPRWEAGRNYQVS